MQLTKEIREYILSQLSDPEVSLPNGVACRFVQWGNIGFKCYATPSDAADSRDSQEEAYHAGFAPEPSKECFRISLGWWGDVAIHGYVTEVAEIDPSLCYCGPEIQELSEAMYKEGMPTNDLKPSNVGWIEGMLVCIDFDPQTISCG